MAANVEVVPWVWAHRCLGNVEGDNTQDYQLHLPLLPNMCHNLQW